MQVGCKRCGDTSFSFSEKMVTKLNLSLEEKEYIFKGGKICVCCILQLKTRFAIGKHKENFNYKKIKIKV